jgi:D-alanine-D-alanine ligase
MIKDKYFEQLKKKDIVILYSEPGTWSEEEQQISMKEVQTMIDEFKKIGFKSKPMKIDENNIRDLGKLDPNKTVVFNWCEGFGDDDYDYFTVPAALDKHGIPYGGGTPESLRLTADKEETKEVLLKARVSTPRSKVYRGNDANGWRKFPALVKPAREHCSFGITRDSVVDNSEQLHKRVDELLAKHGNGVMVEDFIEGEEYNVAIWGNETLEVLPIGMIDYSAFPDYHDRLCGYEAKWVEGSNEWNNTQVVCPAPMSKTLKRNVEKVALAAYKACGLQDYARIDIRVRGNKPYVLDVNSNPDITTSGGFARSLNRAGFGYGEGMVKILCMALKRQELSAKLNKDELNLESNGDVRFNVAAVSGAGAYRRMVDWN